MATRRSSERTAAGSAPPPPVCSVGFCPVAMVLTATQQVRPELVEHVLAAGREFLLAAKALIDARAEDMPRSSPLEKIDVT